MLDPRENRSEAGRILEAMVHEANAANFNIYIVGKTPSGDWAGIKTKAVEN